MPENSVIVWDLEIVPDLSAAARTRPNPLIRYRQNTVADKEHASYSSTVRSGGFGQTKDRQFDGLFELGEALFGALEYAKRLRTVQPRRPRCYWRELQVLGPEQLDKLRGKLSKRLVGLFHTDVDRLRFRDWDIDKLVRPGINRSIPEAATGTQICTNADK
jgi:hypothetical protein